MLSRFLTLVAALLLISSSARAQDTLVTQTLTFDSVGRAGYYHFPAQSEAINFEKVLMQYRMRCIDGAIRTTKTGTKGCGEWDYNCETYVTDSSRIDSVLNTWPSAIISGFNGTAFPSTTGPTESYIKRMQYDAKYPGATFTEHKFGTTETHGLSAQLHADGRSTRIISLFKEWELKDAGIAPGSIYSMKISKASRASTLNGFRIRMRRAATQPDLTDTGWTEVYSNLVKLQTSSDNRFYFYRPFNWTGGDLEVELSYSASPDEPALIDADTTAFSASRVSTRDGLALEFNGSDYFDISSEHLSEINDEISVGMWIYGVPAKNNPSSIIMEGTDGKGHRTFNLHLPWDDGQVYFDCGDETGYDRINTGVTAANVRGRWNHWMFTKNSKTGVMSMYLNGNVLRSDTGRRRQIDIKDLRFGASMLSNNSWVGEATKLTIHKKALDSTMIAHIIDEEGYYGAPADYVAIYPLSIGSGQQIHNIAGASSTLHGNAVWRELVGAELQRGFFPDRRAATTFYQSAAMPTPTTITTSVLDTIAGHTRYARYYSIFRNDSVMTIDSGYVWPAGKQYITNEFGAIVDSFNVAATDTIKITQLEYYSKWPQKFEIMSFVTPYGINLDLGKDGKMWEFDVTDYLPILNGDRRLSVERGAWQEELDIRFLFIKGKPSRFVKDIQQLWPATEENYQSIQSDRRFPALEVPTVAGGRSFKIRSMITGHGQEGEFIPRDHTITVDGKDFTREVWKQCSDNPVYPQGGTWVYSRAGWCPGAPTDLAEYDVTPYIGQVSTIDYTVKTAGGDSRYVVNNQLVTYGSANFENDAAVVEVRRPSDRVEFARFNPTATQPIVTIRNNGGSPLTQVTIEYGVEGTANNVFEWRGHLDFLDTAQVTLPTPATWGEKDTNIFNVHLSLPNGTADQYAKNDSYASRFVKAPTFTGSIVIRYRTNKVPEENWYQITDKDGNIVFENHDATTPSIYYYDSLTLATGNYSFYFFDEGENGINFWATPADGAGTLAFRKNRANSGTPLKTFNPDFGQFVQYDFSVIGPSSVGDASERQKLIRVYPNPAHDQLTIDMAGYEGEKFKYNIVSYSGKRVASGELRNGQVDIAKLASGHYTIVLQGKDGASHIPFVKE